MLLRLGISLAVLLLAVAVAVPCWVTANRTDLADPKDGDLEIVMSDPALGAAGLDAVRRAAALLEEPGLARQREAIAALTSIEIVDLDEEDAEREIADLHQSLLRIVALSGEAARKAADRGSSAAALEQAMLGMRVGRAFSRGNNGLVGMMFARAYQSAALDDLEAVVRSVKMPAGRASELARDLEELRWTSEDWFRAWAFEYQELKTIFLAVDLPAELRAAASDEPVQMVYGLLPPSYLWQPNRTLSHAAQLYRARQRRSRLSCAPRVATRDRDSFDALTAFGPNSVGKILIGVAKPDLDRYETKRCHLEARIGLVQMLLVAKAHWDAHGRLPRSASALASEGLRGLPLDAFRDAPLRYSADARRAWSLGDDFEPGPPVATDPSDPSEPAISLDFREVL